MSTRGFIGLKGGAPVLKIMADAADDPLTTSNTDWEKFRFNSETTDYSFFDDTILWPMGVTTYYPAGRTNANYVLKYEAGYVYCNIARAIAYYGFVPIVLHRYVVSGGSHSVYYRDDTGLPGNPLMMAKCKPQGGIRQTTAFKTQSNAADLMSLFDQSGLGYQSLSLVTRFPADRDYTALTGTPVPGQCFATFDEKNGFARVARAGVDARTAAQLQCIIHEDQRPISVAGAAKISVTRNTTATVTFPFNIPDGCVPLILSANSVGIGNMSSLSYPSASLILPNFVCEAWLSGNTLSLKNRSPTADIVVYYALVLEDNLAPTTGGSGKILYTDAGKVLILRPGANSPPVAADILLSSDYRYCPLVAYGKIADTAFAGAGGTSRTYSLSIPTLANPPQIITCLQKVGADANYNDGDIWIDSFYVTVSPFSVPADGSYYWDYNAATSKINFTVTTPSAMTGWVLRYFILAVPN